MRDDGGPAFPLEFPLEGVNEGMSLLDYFAGQALKGLLADGNQRYPEILAESCYTYAAAMVAEKKKRHGN